MSENPLEATINATIADIENKLLNGHINTNTPDPALEAHVRLGAYISTCYGMIERLDVKEAEYFVNNRELKKSDLAVKKEWKTSHEGIRQEFWSNRIKRLKVLSETVLVLYYHARGDKKYNTVTN